MHFIYNEKTGMNRNSCLFILFLAVFQLVLLVYPTGVKANPQGGVVVDGSANIVKESPKKLTINQCTEKAIINWKSFSISRDELTQFNQPSSNSITLNRVVGKCPSEIFGQLKANGKLMLINQNGILFGAHSRVDVNSLIATTHDIKNSDFQGGRYKFSIPGKPHASVINQGKITINDKGIAAFVAPSVKNSGIIVANLGEVNLVSAKGFTLDFYGDELITILVDKKVAKAEKYHASVENDGIIRAHGGRVLLSAHAAREAMDCVISQTGFIDVRSITEKSGEIVLSGGDRSVVKVSGTLAATNNQGKGGRVEITGTKISLLPKTLIDASGEKGGGTVLVGGDHLGGKATDETYKEFGLEKESKSIKNADYVSIAPEVNILADAYSEGDGGKVVVWSDKGTKAHGATISAKGGAIKGDGGDIEVSGEKGLHIGLMDVSASASNGENGTFITNSHPANPEVESEVSPLLMVVEIDDVPTYLENYDFSQPNFFGSRYAIASDFIQSTLGQGTNVIVGSVSDTDPDALSSIWIEGDIFKTNGGDAKLSFVTTGDIHLDGAITSDSSKLNVLFHVGYERPQHTLAWVEYNQFAKINTNGGLFEVKGAWFKTNPIPTSPVKALGARNSKTNEEVIEAPPEFKSYYDEGSDAQAEEVASINKLLTEAKTSSDKKTIETETGASSKKDGVGVSVVYHSTEVEFGDSGNYGLKIDRALVKAEGKAHATTEDGYDVGVLAALSIAEVTATASLGSDNIVATGTARVASVRGEASAVGKISLDKNKIDLGLKAGAEAHLVKAEGNVSTGTTVPDYIPLFGGYKFKLRIGGEAGVGAQVKAGAHIKSDKKKVSIGAKIGLGLGISVGGYFGLDISFPA